MKYIVYLIAVQQDSSAILDAYCSSRFNRSLNTFIGTNWCNAFAS